MTRQNRNGHPCPLWCTIDHDQELVPGIFTDVHAADPLRCGIGESDRVRVSACLTPSTGVSQVHVSRAKTPLFTPAARAEGLACLVELLADATPEQHRDLAAAIRKAAEIADQAMADSNPAT